MQLSELISEYVSEGYNEIKTANPFRVFTDQITSSTKEPEVQEEETGLDRLYFQLEEAEDEAANNPNNPTSTF